MASLVTVDKYKTVNGIDNSEYDAQISAILLSASDFAKKYCNKNFEAAEYVEKKKGVIDQYGRYMFFTKEKPIISVQSVAIRFIGSQSNVDVDTSYLDIMDQEGYMYYANALDSGAPFIRSDFRDQFNYTITYSGGYTEAPEPVQTAIMLMTHNMMEYLNRTDSAVASGEAVTGELTRLKIGDYEEFYTDSQGSLFAKLLDKDHGILLTKTVLDLLAPYKKMGQSV